jgi:2-methylcitrate dehydratase PrpD
VTEADLPLAQELGAWVAGYDLSADPCREAIVDRAKLHFLDAIGVAFGGLTSTDDFGGAMKAIVDTYRSAPEATLIGSTDRAAAPLAAFYNGALIHSVEFDDTFTERTVHTEAVIVPVALAVGEACGASGAEMVQAWAVGTEVMLRLAAGVDATFALNESGFHTTSVFGAYGAAAAAARLMGLDAAETASALALCTSLTSGTNAGWGVGAARNKSIQPGWAAMAGISAAEMARAGVECAWTTIDAHLGLYYSHAWKSTWTRSSVVERLGEAWKLVDGTFKFHVAGVMMQATLDCAAEIAATKAIDSDEVETVRVLVPHQYSILKDRPGFFDPATPPESAYGVTANWPYSIACVLLNGHLGLADLKPETIFAEPVRQLAGRVEFIFDPDGTRHPMDQETEVAVVTTQGTRVARRGRHSGYFATFDRLRDKFAAITAPLMPDAAIAGIIAAVGRLDSITTTDLAVAITAGAPVLDY